MSKFDLLKQYIDDEIVNVLSIVKSLTTESNRFEKQEKMIAEYKKGIFDLELLADYVDAEKIEYYKNVATTLEELSSSSARFFTAQKDIAKGILDTFIKDLEKQIPVKKMGQVSYNLRKRNEELQQLKELNDSFNNDNVNRIVLEESLERIVELLKKNNAAEEEILNIIFEITKSNAELLEKELQKKKEKTAISQKISRRTKKTANIIVEETQASSEPEKKNVEEIIREENTMDERTAEIYQKLSNMVSANTLSNENGETIEIFLSQIKMGTSVNDRNVIYGCVQNLSARKRLILADIKTNFLPYIIEEKYLDNEDIENINEVIKIYQDLENEIVKETNSFSDSLNSENMKDESELLQKTSELLDMLNNYITSSYNSSLVDSRVYEIVCKLYDELGFEQEEFKTAIELYQEGELTDIKEYHKNLADKYNETYAYFNNMDSKTENVDLVSAYYGGFDNVKNILVFLPNDDTEYSDIADDIINDKNIESINMNVVLRLLQERSQMSMQERAEQADHKAHSDNFSDEFKKKYHVRGAKEGNVRVYYTIFNTNISSYVEKYKNVSAVLFVLALSVAADGPKGKGNELSLKRCYQNKSEINGIVDFLNPNWDKMTEAEKTERAMKIEKYLDCQNKKLEHIMNVSRGRDALKGGNQIG